MYCFSSFTRQFILLPYKERFVLYKPAYLHHIFKVLSDFGVNVKCQHTRVEVYLK